MPLSESDTRAKWIDPGLHARGWTEDLIRREETAGAIEAIEGKEVAEALATLRGLLENQRTTGPAKERGD